jgi:hypothetical protein
MFDLLCWWTGARAFLSASVTLKVHFKSRGKSLASEPSVGEAARPGSPSNPARGVEVPPHQQLAPRVLSPDQRYVLRNLVERDGSRRSAALFALEHP